MRDLRAHSSAHRLADSRAFARLDKGTKLVVRESRVGWAVSAYPEAGEAVVSFAASYQSVEHGGVGVYGDPDANRLRAERRARTMVRRYCTANGINRLASLTFAPPFCTDPAELRQHMSRFFRRFRCERGHPFPYVWVPELHKDKVKLHAHVGLAEFVSKDTLRKVWGHGHVDIRLIRARKTKDPIEHQRQTARYLSKYVGKAFAEQDSFGCHRYDVAEGFQPQVIKRVFDSEEEAHAWAASLMNGAAPVFVWRSTGVEDWQGPPVSVTFFGGTP